MLLTSEFCEFPGAKFVKRLFRGNEINFMSNLIPIAQSHGLKVSILTSLDSIYLTSRCIHTHFETKIHICFMIMGQIQVLNMTTFMIWELTAISQISGNKFNLWIHMAHDMSHWPWPSMTVFVAKPVQIIWRQKKKLNVMFLAHSLPQRCFHFYWILFWWFCFSCNKIVFYGKSFSHNIIACT